MKLIDMISSKIGKTFAIIAMVAMLGGCAGVTDAGFNQDATQQSAQETTQVDDQDQPEQDDPFSNDDEPGVIYDEPDL